MATNPITEPSFRFSSKPKITHIRNVTGKGRGDASSFISDVRVLWMFTRRDHILDYRAGDYLQQGQGDGQSIECMRAGKGRSIEKTGNDAFGLFPNSGMIIPRGGGKVSICKGIPV